MDWDLPPDIDWSLELNEEALLCAGKELFLAFCLDFIFDQFRSSKIAFLN